MTLQERITLLAQEIANDVETLLAQDGDLSTLTTVDKTSLVKAINEVSAATPAGALLAANDLSDLNDPAAARTNLDVYTKAEVDAEDDLKLDIANNLSDLNDVAAARTNLDVYDKAAVDSADALKLNIANNLSDLNDAAMARTNLGVYSDTEVNSEITTAIAAITLGSLGGLDQAAVDARVQVIVDTAPAALDTLNELAAALGDDPNFSATITTALDNRVRFDAAQTLTVAQQLQACDNIGVGNPDHDFVNDYVTERDA